MPQARQPPKPHSSRGSPINLGQDLLDDPSAGIGPRDLEWRFASKYAEALAKPPVCILRIGKNVFRQCLNAGQPNETVRLLDRQGLFLGLSVSLRALRDDELPDFSVRESAALDVRQCSQRDLSMNQAGEISIGRHLLPKDPTSPQLPIDRRYDRFSAHLPKLLRQGGRQLAEI